MTDIEECIKVILTMVISLTTVLAIMFGVMYSLNKTQCEGYHIVTDKPVKYIALNCYVYDAETKQWLIWELNSK